MRIRLLSVLAVTAALAVAGCFTFQRLSAQQNSSAVWSDHPRFATVSLGVPQSVDGRTTFAAICTGLIVSPDIRSAYIVTAKHCFAEPAMAGIKELRVRFAWEQRESQNANTGVQLPLQTSTGAQTWSAAKDGSDVAGIPFSAINRPPTPPTGKFDAITAEQLAQDSDFFDGASVFIYGYPGFAGNNLLTRAVTRSGIIAWTDPQGPSTHKFLVDAAIFPGNSGGPVFKVPTGITRTGDFNVGGTTLLLGLVVQTYAAPQDKNHQEVRVEGLGSLGVVEPVSEVRQLLLEMGATFVTPPPTNMPTTHLP